MKKLLLLLTLAITGVAADTTYICTESIIENRASGLQEYVYPNKNTVVFIIRPNNKLTMGFGKYLLNFKKIVDPGLTAKIEAQNPKSKIEVYRTKNGNILGIYNNFNNGVRFITNTYAFDFVDCTKEWV